MSETRQVVSDKLSAMIRPYYEDEAVTLYHGDCREILPALIGADVEAIITDPPYNTINRDTAGLRKIHKGRADSEPVDIESLAPVFARLARGSVYVWCAQEQLSRWLRAFQREGMTTRTGVWWKTNPSPMNGEHLWLSAIELCAFARHKGATFNLHCVAPVWRFPIAAPNGHPTPKPIPLMAELVSASTRSADLVLDPFAGSGSVLIAAKNLGRRAIGIEIEERYCELAAERLSQNVLALEGA